MTKATAATPTGDELLDSILSLAGDAVAPAAELRCVRAHITAAGTDVATCKTSEGELLLMPVSEFPPQRTWRDGDEIYALRYEQAGRAWLSCNRPELVALLADGVIPELRTGAVRIMGLARSPGIRTKVSVAATVEEVDPIALVVGKAANRVRKLGALLSGERLDVVAWHDDPAQYLKNAFAPAAVDDVSVDGKLATVSVPRHLMAAAVGQRGLNASLAGQLVGVTVTVVPT